MSVVIFTKSSIEAAGTPATGFSYYQSLTINPFYFMGFFERPFCLSRPCTTSLFCCIGSATGLFRLLGPHYQSFMSHRLWCWPFPVIGLLNTSSFMSHGLCYQPFSAIGPVTLGSGTGRFRLSIPLLSALLLAVFCYLGLAACYRAYLLCRLCYWPFLGGSKLWVPASSTILA